MSTPVAVAGAFANRRRKQASRLWDLYLGELNPLITSKANFWLVFAVTAIIALVAMPFFYAEIEGYFVFAYAILPSFTTVFAATTYTRDRASGFASVVQTVPISNAEYFLSKFLASMTLGVIFLGLTLPFTFMAVYFMGGTLLWASFGKYLLFSVPLMMASTALGLFMSVSIGKRGLLASAMTGFAITVVFAGASVLLRALGEEFQQSPAAAAEAEGSTILAIIRQITVLAHLSPVVNAIDFSMAYGENPALAWKNLFTVLWFAAILSLGAWFIYSRLQNVEAWDCPRWVSIASVAAVLGVAAAPVFVLDYFEGRNENGFDPRNDTPPPFYAQVRLVDAKERVDPRTGDCLSCRDGHMGGGQQLRVGETRAMQAIVMVFPQTQSTTTYENVRIRIETSGGSAALRIVPDTLVIPKLSFGQESRPAIVIQRVNVTATGTQGLGQAYAYPMAVTEWNGRTIYGGGYNGFEIIQPAYEWYYPLYLLAFMGTVEAAPFVIRSRRIGKRGL
ncbi:MAG TPA: hypothetical protein VNZ52_13600 [Candidatus Thermoplasmatota archaeon]|nr:hypothetical protein [Candidatus Thermoplasmatota archaeon]